MKHSFIYLTAAAAVLAMSACNNRTECAAAGAACTNDRDVDKVYTGVLPAADADGIRYTLLLDYNDEGNGGDYDMVQTYFANDSTGVNDIATFVAEGDFTVAATPAGGKYLKLDGNGAGDMYFLVDNDSEITMTDASLEAPATPGLNYTLKAAK